MTAGNHNQSLGVCQHWQPFAQSIPADTFCPMTGLNSWFMSSCSFFFCSTVFFYQNQNNNFILLERLEQKKRKPLSHQPTLFQKLRLFWYFSSPHLIVQYFMSVPLVGSPSPKSLCMQNSNVPPHDLVYAQLIEGILAIWSRTLWSILLPSPFFAECFTILPQGDPATKMQNWSNPPILGYKFSKYLAHLIIAKTELKPSVALYVNFCFCPTSVSNQQMTLS